MLIIDSGNIPIKLYKALKVNLIDCCYSVGYFLFSYEAFINGDIKFIFYKRSLNE